MSRRHRKSGHGGKRHRGRQRRHQGNSTQAHANAGLQTQGQKQTQDRPQNPDSRTSRKKIAKESNHRSDNLHRPDPPGLTRLFAGCKVVTHVDRFEGRPYIDETDVEVQDVLDLIDQDLTDEEICKKFNKQVTQYDIDLCRAYQARFKTETLKEIFNRSSGHNALMLDENLSLRLLYDTVRLFGPSSHVYCDGLRRSDDEKDIWAHAIKNKIQAVMTADRDFLRISKQYRERMIEKYGSLTDCPEHIPGVVFFPKNPDRHEALGLMEHNKRAIRRYLQDNDAIYLNIEKGNCHRVYEYTSGKGLPFDKSAKRTAAPAPAPAT